MTKHNYVKSAAAGVAAVAYSLIPQVGEAQTNKGLESLTQTQSELIQKGLQAPKPLGEKTHVLYEMPFNKDLQHAIKNSNNPYLVTTSKDSYVKFNKDSTSLILGVHKNDLGKKIGVGVRDKSAVSPCDENGLGRFENSLPFTYLTINETQGVQRKAQSAPRDTIIQRTNNYTYVFEDNSTTNINFYDAKRDLEKKNNNLALSTTIEGKVLSDASGELTAAIQYGGKGLRVGPYASALFGKDKERKFLGTEGNSEPVDEYGFSSESSGKITQETNSKLNYETGIRLSMGSLNKGLSANLNVGVLDYQTNLGKELHEGTDKTLRWGEVNNEKEYCYETGQESVVKTKSPVVSFDLQKNFGKTGLFLKAGGKYIVEGTKKGFRAFFGGGITLGGKKKQGRTNRR